MQRPSIHRPRRRRVKGAAERLRGPPAAQMIDAAAAALAGQGVSTPQAASSLKVMATGLWRRKLLSAKALLQRVKFKGIRHLIALLGSVLKLT